MRLAPENVTRYDIELHNTQAGYFFFSPGAMRGFSSRVGESVYRSNDGRKVYFVTSERFVSSLGSGQRMYTVRVIDWDTGRITTASEYQQYRSRNAAHNAAQRFAQMTEEETTE